MVKKHFQFCMRKIKFKNVIFKLLGKTEKKILTNLFRLFFNLKGIEI